MTDITPNGTTLEAGKIYWSWCSHCMVRTYHRYEPGKWMKYVCTACEAEREKATA